MFIQAEIKQEHSENNKIKLTNDSSTNTTVKTDSVTNATMNSKQIFCAEGKNFKVKERMLHCITNPSEEITQSDPGAELSLVPTA